MKGARMLIRVANNISKFPARKYSTVNFNIRISISVTKRSVHKLSGPTLLFYLYHRVARNIAVSPRCDSCASQKTPTLLVRLRQQSGGIHLYSWVESITGYESKVPCLKNIA